MSGLSRLVRAIWRSSVLTTVHDLQFYHQATRQTRHRTKPADLWDMQLSVVRVFPRHFELIGPDF